MSNLQTSETSVLAALRGMLPERRQPAADALRLAERQAARLRELTGTHEAFILTDVITSLPHMRLSRCCTLPSSGLSYWNGSEWVICVNGIEPPERQRLTTFHEYKHVIDHGHTERLYGQGPDADRLAESVADYFAGCALVPSDLLIRLWQHGIRELDRLGPVFGASPRAVQIRLSQVGLAAPPPPKQYEPMQHRAELVEPTCLQRSREDVAV